MQDKVLSASVAAVLLLTASGCVAPTETSPIRTYLEAYENTHLSSGVVLAARGNSVVFTEGFGAASVATGARNTTATQFRIGSITKSMTWAAIHRLVEEGTLDLDAPVADLIGTPALPRSVTTRLLLTHQAGVADWGTYEDAHTFTARPSSTAELVTWIASKPLAFTPGTGRRYSNSGYVLLARAIEAASGRAYGDFLSQELFTPLGMAATRSVVEPADIALGYVTGHQPAPIVPAERIDPSIYVGSGSVVSTASDLFTWSRSEAAHVFPWDTRTRHNRDVEFMGGFVPGFGAWLEHFPAEDVTVIVLTNLNNGAIQKIVTDVGAMVLGEPFEAPAAFVDRDVSADMSPAYAGAWACPGGSRFTIQLTGARLDLLWRHQPPLQPVWLQADGALFYPQSWAVIRPDESGTTRALTYVEPGSPSVRCTPVEGR